MWPFKKKSADHALKEFVDSLAKDLGPRLVSVLVYGSKASGEDREGQSNVNVFLVLETGACRRRSASPTRPICRSNSSTCRTTTRLFTVPIRCRDLRWPATICGSYAPRN